MRIGIPRERKVREGRVALAPAAVATLVAAGHEVWLESGAGVASGFSDGDYQTAGARLAADNVELYARGELIVKVKEPIADDLTHLRSDHRLFCFLHLAAEPVLTDRLCQIGLTALAFETLSDEGRLPLLAPMSDIAGRVAVQLGARYLHQPMGGSGVLLGGISGTPRGRVVVLGAGVAGLASAALAAGMGAEVIVFDRKPESLHRARVLGANVTALFAEAQAVAESVPLADLLIGAVLVPGAAAPRLISRAMVRTMRPGSVIVDIAIDQGGCVETIHATTWEHPAYLEEGVVHVGVTNLPGAVPRTATQALSGHLLPYVLRLAATDPSRDPVLASAVNVRDGHVVLPALSNISRT